MILRPFALLLPALIPSWNFFDVIAPSPRIEIARLVSVDTPRVWQEFAPLDLSQVGRKVEARFDLRFTATPDVNDSDFRFGFGDRSTNQGMALAMLDLGDTLLLPDLGDVREVAG